VDRGHWEGETHEQFRLPPPWCAAVRWEIAEARKVFGDSLHYGRIRIHECATWADAMTGWAPVLRNCLRLGQRSTIL